MDKCKVVNVGLVANAISPFLLGDKMNSVLLYGKFAIVLAKQIPHICFMKIYQDEVLGKLDFARMVGLKLRSIRQENNMTIEATALGAGMDYTQLSRIELGKINTSLFQIYKISKSLNVHIVDIVNELP